MSGLTWVRASSRGTPDISRDPITLFWWAVLANRAGARGRRRSTVNLPLPGSVATDQREGRSTADLDDDRRAAELI
jgi:hypothetical protein